MKAIIVFYLQVLCVATLSSKPTATSRILSRRIHSSMLRSASKEYRCIGLMGATDEDTTRLRRECRVTMETEFMRQSWRMLTQASQKQLHEARLRYFTGHTRTRRSVNECPTLTDDFVSGGDVRDGQANLSPYKAEPDFNPLRFPKFIMQMRCLCEGCIDPRTRQETLFLNKMPVNSKAVKSQILVWYKTTASNLEKYPRPGISVVSVGCHCMISTLKTV